jgi:membrane protein implicated in regulation of membrane protease activity
MIFIARGLGIGATCYSVNFIPWNTWWGILIWAVFLVAIIAMVVCIYKYMDKIQQFLKQKTKKYKK